MTGALTFGLEVAPLTDVDIQILHGCLVSLLYKFLGRRAYRFQHGRIVAKTSTEKLMQMTDLRPLSETLRVRRLHWLRKQLFWKRENTQPSWCSAALMGHFEWESEPPVTVEGGLGTSAPALLRLLYLEAAGLRPISSRMAETGDGSVSGRF